MRKQNQNASLISTASAITQSDDNGLRTIQLFKMGQHQSRSGTPKQYVIEDLAHAQQVVDATLAHYGDTEIMIDYDHQAVTLPKLGGSARAAGWVKKLYANAAGIFADVEFTQAASSGIKDKEYRYISPASLVNNSTGRVRRIVNAALTNTPDLDLLALASAVGEGYSDQYQEEDIMNEEYMKKLAAMAVAMGLPENASAEDIMKCIEKDQMKLKEMKAMASILAVDVDADPALITAAASALVSQKTETPDPAKFVPVAALEEMTLQIASMAKIVDNLAVDKRTSMIAAAANRLPPSLKSYAETIKDEAVLASFLNALPETGLGKQTLSGDAAAGDAGADEEEIKIASMMGVSADEFKAARKLEVQ